MSPLGPEMLRCYCVLPWEAFRAGKVGYIRDEEGPAGRKFPFLWIGPPWFHRPDSREGLDFGGLIPPIKEKNGTYLCRSSGTLLLLCMWLSKLWSLCAPST